MNSTNVNSKATIIQNNNTEEFKFGSFPEQNLNKNDFENSTPVSAATPVVRDENDPLLAAIKDLTNKISTIEHKVSDIQNGGLKAKEIDAQLVTALRDLKNYAQFFEQATFQLESKILKTSMNIAQKIINVELSEQSEMIAMQTIKQILSKIKTASSITIHLNPKDYLLLKDQLQLESFIKLQEDENVTAGGVVIASDLGNFDGNVESKVQTILESLDIVS
jgi:flagellar assembly protein FliH